jgi:hypothetical protein
MFRTTRDPKRLILIGVVLLVVGPMLSLAGAAFDVSGAAPFASSPSREVGPCLDPSSGGLCDKPVNTPPPLPQSQPLTWAEKAAMASAAAGLISALAGLTTAMVGVVTLNRTKKITTPVPVRADTTPRSVMPAQRLTRRVRQPRCSPRHSLRR